MATYEELLDYANKYNPQPQQELGVNSFDGGMIQQEETPYQKMMRETYGAPAQQQEEQGILGSVANRMSGQPQQQGAEEPGFLSSLYRGAMAQGIGTLGGQADFVAGATGSETLRNLGDTAQKAMQEYSRPHEYTFNDIFGNGLSSVWKYLSDPNGAAYDIGGGLGSTAAMAAEAALLSAALPSSVAAAGTGAVAAFATRLGLKSVAGALKGGSTAGKLIKNVIASTPLEAASESGGTYREMTTDEQGNRLNMEDIDMDKVQEAMAKNFVGNLGVLGASNLLESVGIGKLFGEKMRQGILGKVRDIGGFMMTNAGQNAWEEGAQTGSNLYAQGKIDNISQIVNPFEWNPEQIDAATIGGIAGLGQGTFMGGAGHVLNKIAGPQQQEGNPAVNIQNKVTNEEFGDAVAIAKHDTSTNLVDRMRNLEGRIGHHASDGTNCARTIGLALAGTDYQDLINVDDFVKIAQNKGQLKDPNSYVPKPGDLAVVNDGNHIVMVSENGGTIQNGSSRDGVYESAQSPLQMFGSVKYYISTSDLSSGDYGVAGNLQGVNEEQRQQEYYKNLVAQESQRRADAIREVLGAKTHEQEQQEQAVSEAQKYQQENASELGPISNYYNAFTEQELAALTPEQKQTLKNNFDNFYADKQNWGHTAIEKVQMARQMYSQLIGNRQQTATVQQQAQPQVQAQQQQVAQPTPVQAANVAQAQTPQVQQQATSTTAPQNQVVQQEQQQVAEKEEVPFATEEKAPFTQEDVNNDVNVHINSKGERTWNGGFGRVVDERYKTRSEAAKDLPNRIAKISRNASGNFAAAREKLNEELSDLKADHSFGEITDAEYNEAVQQIDAANKNIAEREQKKKAKPTKSDVMTTRNALVLGDKLAMDMFNAWPPKKQEEMRQKLATDQANFAKKARQVRTSKSEKVVADAKKALDALPEAMRNKAYADADAQLAAEAEAKAKAKAERDAKKKAEKEAKAKAKAEAEAEKQAKAKKGEKKNAVTEQKPTELQKSEAEQGRDKDVNTEPKEGKREENKNGETAEDQGKVEVKENGSDESGLSGLPETEQTGAVSADAEGRETGAVPGPANGTGETVSQANDEVVRNGASKPRPARTRRLSGESKNVGGKTDEQTTLWGRVSRTVRAFANSIRQLCEDHEDDKVELDDLREEIDDILDKIDKEIDKAEKTTAQQDYDNYFKHITVYVGGKDYHAELFPGPRGKDAIRWASGVGALADRGSKRSLGILMWHTLMSRDAKGNYPSLDKVLSSIKNYYKKHPDVQISQAYQDAIEYGEKLKKQKKDIVVEDNRPDNTTKYSATETETSTVEEASNTEKGERLKRSLDDLIREAKQAFRSAKNFRINRDDLIFTMPNGVEMKVNIKEQILLNATDEAKARKDHGISEGGLVAQGYTKRLGKGSLVVLSKEGQRGTAFHETFHTVWDWVLTDKEKAAMLKHFTPIAEELGMNVEEVMADGYRDWLLARQQHRGTIFGKLYQKIKDFVDSALTVLTGAENVNDIYRQIESGKVWNRDAKGRFATEENAVNNDKKFLVTNKKITANTPVTVVNITKNPKFNMTGPEIKKAVLDLIHDTEGNPIRFTIQGEGPIGRVANVDMGKHIFRSSDKRKDNLNSSARQRVLSGVQDLFESAIYVEKHPDVKGRATKWIELYAVAGNENDNTMTRFRVVAKEGDPGSGKFEVSDVKFYDIIKDGIVSANPSKNVGNRVTTIPSSISIAQLLDGVKDRNGKPYVVNGKLQYEPGVLGNKTKYSVSSDIARQYPHWMDNQTAKVDEVKKKKAEYERKKKIEAGEDPGEEKLGKKGQNTQTTSTISTYKKLASFIKEKLSPGTRVLDASSGLGLGTQVLRETLGKENVDDIEPYAGESRMKENPPTYGGMGVEDAYQQAIDDGKQYDFVISNAVLNVIPDDWRRGVLYNMAKLMAPGGTMFINVRGVDEAENIKNKIELESPNEVLVTTGKEIPITSVSNTGGTSNISRYNTGKDAGGRDIKYKNVPKLDKDGNQETDKNGKPKTTKVQEDPSQVPYRVGKEMDKKVYFHKDYARYIVPADMLKAAESVAKEKGFDYNCMVYDKKNHMVRFDSAENFDRVREPIPGKFLQVYFEDDDKTVKDTKTGYEGQIWHHKWMWVDDNYQGFDVEESKDWSRKWLGANAKWVADHFEELQKAREEAIAQGKTPPGKEAIGNKDIWHKFLTKIGLKDEIDNTTTGPAKPGSKPKPNIQAYQRLYTKDELKSYIGNELNDKLNDGYHYDVEIATKKNVGTDGKVAVKVTKSKEPIHFSVRQQEFEKQKEDVRKQYEGTKQWMKAPNGDESNLTEDQWVTVRTPAFKDWFGDWENDPNNASKVLDENGEPLQVYHGTVAGEFDTFDRSYGSVEGDMGAGFYFTNNEYDVKNNYEGGGPDFEIKVERLAEQIAENEDVDYDEAKKMARDELFTAPHLFELYLNMRNPANVANDWILGNEVETEELDRDDYDSDEDFEQAQYDAQGDAWNEIVDRITNRVENEELMAASGDVRDLSTALWNAITDGGLQISHLKKEVSELYPQDADGNFSAGEIVRIVVEELGYDGIVDSTVSRKFRGMDLSPDTVHYIAFEPNQVKDASGRNTGFDKGKDNIYFSVRRDRPGVMSSRWTKAKTAKENSLDNVLVADFKTLVNDYDNAKDKSKAALTKLVDLMNETEGLAVDTKDPKKAAETIIRRIKSNLKYLHELVPPELRDRAKKWYDGGRKMAEEWSKRYGISPQACAGVVAVLSPQKNWFENVSLAERILDCIYGKGKHVWDEKMTAAATIKKDADDAEGMVAQELVPELNKAKGKTLQELIDSGDYIAAGIWIRAYDKAHNEKYYRVVTPEGGTGDYQYNADGKTKSAIRWQSYGAIAKAISIAVNPDYSNIFYQLGDKHKVRNFYNNLYDPDNLLFATIDTHAVGAALLQAVSGKTKAVEQNFGTDAPNSNVTGLKGTYAIYYEAYRQAAEELGIKPRELQSITWEAVRNLFPDTMKDNDNETPQQKEIRELWGSVGKQLKEAKSEAEEQKILAQTQKDVYDIATKDNGGKLNKFAWQDTHEKTAVGDTYNRKGIELTNFNKDESGNAKGFNIGFNFEPNSENKELAKLLKKLEGKPEKQAEAIKNALDSAIQKVMAEFDMVGESNPALSVKNGETKGSFIVSVKYPQQSVPFAKMMGYVLGLKSVAVVTSQEVQGTKPGKAISIQLPSGWGSKEISEFGKVLEEIQDREGNPVTSAVHSVSGGKMTIVNTSEYSTDTLVDLIKEKAPELDVSSTGMYSTVIGSDQYGYQDERKDITVKVPDSWSKKKIKEFCDKVLALENEPSKDKKTGEIKPASKLVSLQAIENGVISLLQNTTAQAKTVINKIKTIAPEVIAEGVPRDEARTEDEKKARDAKELRERTLYRRANNIRRGFTEELGRELRKAGRQNVSKDATQVVPGKGSQGEGKNKFSARPVLEQKENGAGLQVNNQTESTQGNEGASSSPKKFSVVDTLNKAANKVDAYANRNVREPNDNTATGRAARAFNNTQNKNNAQTFTEWLKDRVTKFYREWVDKNDALHKVDDAIERITGKKLAEEDKVYNMAQGARAYAQGAADTLVQGSEQAFNALRDSLERGIDPKDTDAMDRLAELKKDFKYATMQKVLEPIMTKDMDRKYPDYLEKHGLNNWHDAFSNYLGARRLLELLRLIEDKSLQYITHDKKEFEDFIDRHPEYEAFRPKAFQKGSWRDQVQKMAQAEPALAEAMAKDLAKEYKLPKNVSRADLEAMVREAPKEFGTSAQTYYQLQRNMLTMMELGHLIPAAVHDKINEMYKDYCPLMIDYSDTAGLETAIAQFGRGADSIANVDSMLKHVLQLGSDRGLISPLESSYKSIQALTNRAERNKVAVHFVKTVANSPELQKEGILKKVPGSSPDAKNCIFTALINGKKVAFQTKQELYGPIVGYDMPAAGIVEGFCRSSAQWLRYGATTSPSFIIRNFLRDTIFAGISSRNGFIPFVDSAKGLWAYWKNKELRGEFDAMGISAYNYFGSGKNAVKSMEELMGEKDLQYLKEHPTELIKELFKMVPRLLEGGSELIEASTRMGEYMRARKNGKSMQEAALDARDVTLDFSRSGFYGQRVNMMVPFFNACIQGGDKMFNRMLFSKDPKVRAQTVRMVGLYIMLPSMILWALHKDEPWYEELDPHIKMNNWIIGKFRIPKPQEAGIAFGSGIEAMLDKIYNKDPKAGKEWRAAMLDVLLPNLIPTAGLPILEWITNYSIFRDKAIEGNRLKRLPTEMRYNTSTTEISKAISKAVGGAYGASPVKLDNTIRGYTGTLGMLVAQIPDMFFENQQNLPSKNATERMMVRDFFINDMNLNRTSEDFYNLVNAAQQQHAGYGKKGHPTPDVKAINKALRDVSLQQKDIQEITNAKGISQDAKRQMIDRKRNIIKTIQKATLKRYGNKYDI